MKRLRAKTRTQEERIETLTRRLAGERESRSGRGAGRRRTRRFVARTAAARTAASGDATARHRSPPTSVPSDFDAYIDGLVAETARFRATLAGARA